MMNHLLIYAVKIKWKYELTSSNIDTLPSVSVLCWTRGGALILRCSGFGLVLMSFFIFHLRVGSETAHTQTQANAHVNLQRITHTHTHLSTLVLTSIHFPFLCTFLTLTLTLTLTLMTGCLTLNLNLSPRLASKLKPSP